MDKTNVKLETFASDDDLSNEKTVIAEHHVKSIKIKSTTSANEYQTGSKTNIKVETVSDANLDHERGCFYTSNSDLKMDSKIIIKEEPTVSEAELQNFEYLDCLSPITKLENDAIINKDLKMDNKMQSIKQEFVSDVTSQNDTKCFSVDLLMKIKKEITNSSDRVVETITKQEIDFKSKVASFYDASQENTTKEGYVENMEATSESPRLTRDAVDHDFKPNSGNSVNKDSSMRANTLSFNSAPSGRKHFESAETIHDEGNVLHNSTMCGENIINPLVCLSQLTSYICEEHFKQKSPLKIDPLDHSSRIKSHKCDICGKIFTWGTDLIKHKLIHPGTKPYKCEHCEKCFRWKSGLNQHRLLHTGTKTYKCEDCKKCFTQQPSLIQHRLLHSGTNTFNCDQCDKCFTSKSKLKNHILTHLGSLPYKCEHCDKGFTQKGALNVHKLRISGSKSYKCQQCDKCFSLKSYLDKHKLVHLGSKPHQCEHCGKCFRHRRALNQHKLLHSGIKAYKCECCNKDFTQKSGLTQHKLVHLVTKTNK